MLRPTNMALAFAKAAIKTAETQPVSVTKGTGNWIARKVVISADNKGNYRDDNKKKNPN